MYIDGKFTDSESGETFDVIEPSTEAHLATVPHASIVDLDRAVAAARAAFTEGPWASTIRR